MRRFQFTSTTLSFRYQPLFAVAVVFALGILAEHFLGIDTRLLLTGFVGFLLISIALTIFKWQSYPFVLIGILFAGATLTALEMRSLSPDRLRYQVESGNLKTSEPAEIIGTLVAPPERVPGRIYLD